MHSMLFLSILIDKSSVCLLWRGLKTIKLDFFKLIDNLLAWHHCVSCINSEFKNESIQNLIQKSKEYFTLNKLVGP